MKKLYLLPLSMILMTTGYADEPQQTQSENVAQEQIVQTPETEKNVARTAPANRAEATQPDSRPTPSKPSDSHGHMAPETPGKDRLKREAKQHRTKEPVNK